MVPSTNGTCARGRNVEEHVLYATVGNTESAASGGTLQKARGSTRPPPPQTTTTNAPERQRRVFADLNTTLARIRQRDALPPLEHSIALPSHGNRTVLSTENISPAVPHPPSVRSPVRLRRSVAKRKPFFRFRRGNKARTYSAPSKMNNKQD
uniref:Uncharacterized protein n=1 Tax=Sipha flava TaxID=143950 RepID=A0A2S2R8R9_9HEMI